MRSPAQNLIRHERFERSAPFALAFVGIVISVCVWQFRLRFPFDDVYITFRYAEHVASGHGLVWNIGGPHTEGYTNLLFVLLLAAARFITSDLLLAAQILGLSATIVTGLAIYGIARNVRNSEVGIIAALLYFLTPITWVNGLSGMETSLFVMLTSIATLCATRKRWSLAYIFVFLAALTHPEGVMLGLILLFATTAFQETLIDHRTLRSIIKPFLFAFVLPLAAYTVWKYLYFGELLPNSFYVKVLSNANSLLPGLQYVRLFLMSSLVLVALSFGISKLRDPSIWMCVLWIFALLAFYLFVLPLEGLYDRYLWPAFAMLCVTASFGVYDLVQRMRIRSILVPAAIAIIAQFSVAFISPRTQQAMAAHEDVWDASMGRIVQALKLLPHAESLTLGYGDAGYVVYRSGLRHIDLFGLNDTRIAHARSTTERANILLSEKPDVLLLPVYSLDTGGWVEDAYGAARMPTFVAVATTNAFPHPLAWVLNMQSPYYEECKMEITRELRDSSSYLKTAPLTR